jgi:hypothetical protein
MLFFQDDEEANAPLEQEQDKIAFIFNNLSLMNLKQKADDLRWAFGVVSVADADPG